MMEITSAIRRALQSFTNHDILAAVINQQADRTTDLVIRRSFTSLLIDMEREVFVWVHQKRMIDVMLCIGIG